MPARFSIILVTALLLATPVSAEQLLLRAPPEASADATRGVFVRDSAVAAEKLALAQRMERLKEWDKSADVFQEIVEKYADRVVPTGEAQGEKRYSSVTLAVQDLLGKWPEEGLAAYRARFETPATTLLEAADPDDASALSRVVQLYFPTDAAKAAALRLTELYIETGEFAAAAWLGERLLGHHPALGADRPRLLFRTALAQHLAANGEAAKPKLEELKAQHPTAVAMVRGEEVVLAGELETLLAAPPAVEHGRSADSWPTLGGDASRGRVPVAAGRPGARLVEIPLPRPRQRPVANNPELRGQLDAIERDRRNHGLSLAIMPVVDRNEIFFQDNTRVYAKSLDGGLTLPGWLTTYGDDSKPRFTAPTTPAPTSAQLTVTVTDQSVLAVLGQYDQSAFINEMGVPMLPDSSTQLVCLDRATGARRWSVSPQQFPESLANLRSLDLGGSPLVVGDNVYVAARGGKPMQFEDAYVLCFNLADGKIRWACYLASGNAPDQNYGGNALPRTGIPHLAYAGGRLYSVTNIGAVAAIDAHAGTIIWLNLYPRTVRNPMVVQLPQPGMASTRKPWALNPAIVRDGRVFCLPSDAQHVLVYDAGNGDEIKRIPLGQFENSDTLLGVAGDKLIVSGRNKVFCINWPAYDIARRAEENVHWIGVASILGTEEQNKDTVRGRGFVTAEHFFIPTTVALRRFSMQNGRIVDNYPSDGVWNMGEGPGNVIVTQDQVILAGADSIAIYGDLAVARAKLDKAVEQAPQNPLPRLRYADTLFAAGQVEGAVAKLDEAIAMLGGLKTMRPGADRDRAFTQAMAFAERAAEPKVGSADPALANSLYDRAGAAAHAPAQQVAYRFSRARLARRQQDFPTEVRLYQEILADAQLRQVIVPSEDGPGTSPAGTVAEATIAQRIKDAPALYRPFEAAAEKALAEARATADPQRMLAVAQTYPNARVAPDALLAAADSFEADGKHRQATQVLNQANRKYSSAAQKPRVLEALARNYLRLPNGVGIAIGRLREGMNLPGGASLKQPLTLPDGGTIEGVSFGAAAELLQNYSARLAAATLPDFKLATFKPREKVPPFLPESPDWVLSDVDLLVQPPRQLRDRARHDRVITWSAENGLSIYAVGSNSPLAKVASFTQRPLGAAWLGAELLVWTNDKVALLSGDGAATMWETSIRSLPPVEVLEAGDKLVRGDPSRGLPRGAMVGQGMIVVDNQVINLGRGRIRMGAQPANAVRPVRPAEGQPEQIEHVLPVGDRVIIGTSSGRIASLDLARGEHAWQTRLGTVRLDQLLANDDFIATRFVDEAGAQLVALDTFEGQVVTRLGFSNTGLSSVVNAALAPDGTLVYTLPDRICGRDLYEPGKPLKFGETPTADGTRLFEGATGPDQLVIAEGRIFAAADQGQFIRELSLDTGTESPNPRSTGAIDWRVWMRVVGPRLYVFNHRTVIGYSLERSDSWVGSQGGRGSTPNVRDAYVGKGHVVLLHQPTPLGMEAAPQAPHFRLLGYSRKPLQTGGEGGRLDVEEDITHPIGIDQWQPVEGGFYYRSVDGKAHFLKGAAGGE